jgi:transcriptional regulator with XRE-family HTH domain
MKRDCRLYVRIKAARKAKKLTLRDVERLSNGNISNVHVSEIENGLAHPSPRMLRQLSEVLELDFLKLMILAGHITQRDITKGRV